MVLSYPVLNLFPFSWSFGVLLFEVFTMGGSPYPGLSVHQVIQFVSDGLRMTKTHEIPMAIYQIMLNCWKENPDERPTFQDLIKEINDLVEAPDDVSILINYTQIELYIGVGSDPNQWLV